MMKFFKRHKIKNNGNNQIDFSKKNCREYVLKVSGENNELKTNSGFNCKYLEISIKGNGNRVFIGKNFSCYGKVKIYVSGNHNKITLNDDITVIDGLTIYNHENGQNCVIDVGNKTSFYKTELYCYDKDSSVTIGEDCMFGYDTVIYNTDGHTIFQDGEVVNQGEALRIGNHVWLAQGAEVLKNSTVSDGCIVARRAVVCGYHEEKNVVLGGLPAKIIKRNILWDRKTVNDALDSGK